MHARAAVAERLPSVALYADHGSNGKETERMLGTYSYGVQVSLPIFVVALILQVTGIWNDFLFGVIFAGTTNFPITVQLNNIVNSLQGVKEYNVDMAATILTGAVPLFIYFVSGKLFVRGIAAGAVKG